MLLHKWCQGFFGTVCFFWLPLTLILFFYWIMFLHSMTRLLWFLSPLCPTCHTLNTPFLLSSQVPPTLCEVCKQQNYSIAEYKNWLKFSFLFVKLNLWGWHWLIRLYNFNLIFVFDWNILGIINYTEGPGVRGDRETSFIQQLLLKHLMCAKHCSRYLGYISEQNRQKPHSSCIYFAKGRQNKYSPGILQHSEEGKKRETSKDLGRSNQWVGEKPREWGVPQANWRNYQGGGGDQLWPMLVRGPVRWELTTDLATWRSVTWPWTQALFCSEGQRRVDIDVRHAFSVGVIILSREGENIFMGNEKILLF